MIHYLKTVDHPFQALWAGKKRHEVRRWDRDFKEGDWVILQETVCGVYSGRSVLAKIGYPMPPSTWGQSDTHGCFTLLHIQNFEKDDDPLSVLV